MALSNELTLPNGVVLKYWRITSMQVVVNQQIVIEVTGYTSEEKRLEEQQALAEAQETGNYPETNIYLETQFFNMEYDPEMSVTKAYAYLKTLEQFEGSEDVIDAWSAGQSYYTGDAVMYGSKAYRCIQPHDSQEGWEPSNVPALWKEDTGSSDGIPEWAKPTGAHDAYFTGDHVMHDGKEWVSAIDANVWEPGVYGWDEA